ncbi:MAG TPA: ATP-binding protein [Chitinophagaceae bacterium]
METILHSVQKNNERAVLSTDEFLELAVHDLDAPLRKLMLLTERMEEKYKSLSLPDELSPYLQRISSCANDMRILIDDLHLLTAIKEETVEFTACKLDEIIQQVLKQLHVYIEDNAVSISLNPLPIVKGDKKLLELLFKNLVKNAIQFRSADDDPSITIRSFEISATEKDNLQLEPGKEYYRIEVIDNGVGFKNGDIQKIFSPFVSLHGKSKLRGSGMGLATCEKIVALHNGVISATGNEERGATFFIILPQPH